MPITLQTHITFTEKVLFRDFEGEAIVLHLDTGKYFTLDSVGSRMWTLLGQDAELALTYRHLLDEYEVAPEQLHSDLIAFVERLHALGLVVLEPARPA